MPDRQARLDELTVKLKEKKLRLTPQRMAVLKILATSDGHLSVEQIYERVKADFPMTSLATIYKTVTVLKEMGEVLEIGFSDAGNRYDINKPYPHPHLICVSCKKIIDADLAALSELSELVAQSSGYRIVNQRLDFFGICPECQAQEQAWRV